MHAFQIFMLQHTCQLPLTYEFYLISDLESPDGFAIDWISQNMFVTTSGPSSRIIASNLDGEYIVNIISDHLNSPRSLAVDPIDG